MKTKLIKVALLVMSTLTLSLLSYHIHRTWDYDTSLQCPEKMIFLEDLGRFGNKFWEYLAARIISQAQQTQLYVTKDLSKFFNRYFKDLLHAEAVNVKHFRKQCNANLWEQVFLNVTDISSPLPTWSHIHGNIYFCPKYLTNLRSNSTLHNIINQYTYNVILHICRNYNDNQIKTVLLIVQMQFQYS